LQTNKQTNTAGKKAKINIKKCRSNKQQTLDFCKNHANKGRNLRNRQIKADANKTQQAKKQKSILKCRSNKQQTLDFCKNHANKK
jgi:hypothetical protein